MASYNKARTPESGFALTALAVLIGTLFVPTLSQAQAPAAGALPSGARVTAGSAAIQSGANAMTIRQSSANLITNWKSFDIGRDAKVEFIQPSSTAVALNRVTGGSATQIFGMLKANGRIFLVNPEGILFGASARVDAGGLVASTMKISDQDFLAGKYQFDLDNAAGRIQNFGELVSRQGGFVALLGAEVDNAGRIVATGSQAALAAGSKVRLQLGEAGLIGMDVEAARLAVNVNNTGVIVAEGGNVLMSAQGAQNLLAGAVNHAGVIRATRIEGAGGEVRLSGDVVSMPSQAVIETQGAGASVVIRSFEATRFEGRIEAPGAFVDTSSSGNLRVTGSVTAGEWLLDPPTLTIVETVTGANQQSASSIQNSLNTGTNVTLQALQSITVDADISKTSGGGATLTFASEQPGGGAPANTSASFFINKQISSIAGPLSIQFGGSAADSQGSVTLSAPLATNGGSVTFFKETNLAHASPVSTKITESSSAQSGSIVFHQNAWLMAPGYAVSLNTQGPQSGGSYTGKGGNIDFRANIYSKAPVGLPSYAQALTLDTTGYNAAQPLTGPGQILLGSAATHVVGGSTRTAGNVDAIRSLTLLGPMSIDLNAGTINIVSSNGDVLVAESRLGSAQNAPDILLKAPATVINIYGDPTGNLAGNVAGYTDYVQSTFDLRGTSANQTLAINSDRAIKLIDRSIAPAAGQALQVSLNPNQAGGSGVGGVVMNKAAVSTGGAAFSAGTATNQPALGNGVDAQLLTDGFYAFNSQINTVGTAGSGTLTIIAEAPRDTAAGAGIRLVGAETMLSSGSANLTLTGKVTKFAASGNKEGVIVGEGGNARVTLNTTSGNISITGDTSGVPSNDSVTGGSSYTGVVLSSRALIETTSGNITIEGKGGGGDKVFIAENHGIRFSDAGTSVISASGNIAFAGTSGGKTRATSGANSFGIYAEGANMYVGTPDTAYETLGANLGLLKAAGPTATGNITFAGDSMQFVNTSTNHLKVAAKGFDADRNPLSNGELRIHTLNAATRIESGTPGEVADTDNRATLYLGNNWFNGSVNGIFQPGFRNIVIGNAGSNVLHARGEVAVVGSTVPLTIAQATTFRDNLVLDMSGVVAGAGGGSVLIPANLIVQGSGAAARTLTINTREGATATGVVTAASMQLLGSGDQTFTAGNLIGTLSSAVDGKVTLNNAQALTVGRVGVFGVADGQNVWLDLDSDPNLKSMSPLTGNATVGVTSTNKRVTLTATAGSITLSDFINSGTDDTLLYAVAGEIKQLPTVGARDGYVNARGLSAVAPQGVDLFQSAQNDVDMVAGRVTNGDFALRDKDGFSVGTVASHMPPATNPPGVSLPLQGIIASANADLRADSGNITQTQFVQAYGVRAQAPVGSVELDGRKADDGMSDWNNVSTLSGRSGARFAWRDADDVTVATVRETAGIEAGTLIDLRSQAGAIGQTSAGYVKANDLHLGAATGVWMDTAKAGDVSTNAVARLSGSTLANDFVFRNVGNLTLDTIAGVAGVSALAGNISLDSGGLLDQSATGAVKTNALRVIAATGIGLNQSDGNDVVTLGGLTAAGNLAYTDANNVTVAAVGVDDRKAPGSARLNATGLSAQGLIDIVSTAGLIAQTAQGAITADSLRAIGPKGVALAHSDSNNVATLAGSAVNGHFAYRDINAFTVGTTGTAPNTTSGISANTVSGTADLQATAGDITQSVNGVIRAHALRALATTGGVHLSTAGNDVDLLAGATASSRKTPGDFRFRDVNGLTVATVASTRDAAVKTVGITTDTTVATVDLQAGGALAQNQGTVAANKLRLAGQTVDFRDRANQVSELAGTAASGGFAFYAGSDLTIGQVEPTAGVTAAGLVDVQARGNLVLKQPVVGVGAGNEMTDNAVILRAEKRFHNETGLGAAAIDARAGRWLVYDDNPQLLDKGMKGLSADREFLLVDTRYQDYPPGSVYARGDGYITTAKLLEPADVVRDTIGHQSVAVGVSVTQVAGASLAPVVSGRTPLSAPAVVAAPSLAAAAPTLPLQVSVNAGAPFRVDLKPLVGNGRLVSVTTADGATVNWAAVDSANGQLIGSAPASAQLEVTVMSPGESVPRRLRVSLQAR
jgi:filamentous hemagglutinin family protein